MLIHSIQDEAFMTSLSVTSKMNSDWRFLTELRDAGRSCAGKWLDEHLDDVGIRASTDIEAAFL
jgi:NTE family protein